MADEAFVNPGHAPHPAVSLWRVDENEILLRGAVDDVSIIHTPEFVDALTAHLKGDPDALTGAGTETGVDAAALLEALAERAIIVEAPANADGTAGRDHLADLLEFVEVTTDKLRHEPWRENRRHRTAVLVIGTGLLAAAATRALGGLGAEVTVSDQPDGGADVILVCADQENEPEFLKVNAAALLGDAPFLFASTDGYRGRIGPAVVPRQSGCYACLINRLVTNAEHPGQIRVHARSRPVIPARAPVSGIVAETLGALAAVQALKIAAGLGQLVPGGTILDVDFLSLTMARGIVLRSPRCAACGRLPDSAARSMVRAGNLG